MSRRLPTLSGTSDFAERGRGIGKSPLGLLYVANKRTVFSGPHSVSKRRSASINARFATRTASLAFAKSGVVIMTER